MQYTKEQAQKYAQDASHRETLIDRLQYLRSLQDKETKQQRDILVITL